MIDAKAEPTGKAKLWERDYQRGAWVTATTDTIVQCLLANPEARIAVLNELLGLKVGDTCVMHATEALAASKRATEAERNYDHCEKVNETYRMALTSIGNERDELKAKLAEALKVGVWTDEESDGMLRAFYKAQEHRGMSESMFAVGAWLLRHRAGQEPAPAQPQPSVSFPALPIDAEDERIVDELVAERAETTESKLAAADARAEALLGAARGVINAHVMVPFPGASRAAREQAEHDAMKRLMVIVDAFPHPCTKTDTKPAREE